jgi:soluble lytic murein transglycosylase
LSDHLKVAVLAGLLVFMPLPATAGSDALSPDDIKAAKAALKAVGAEKWRSAHKAAAKAKDPLVAKIVDWFDFIRPETRARFAEISAFITENSHWPYQKRLQRRTEEAMTETTPANVVLSWFETREPASVDGRVRLGAALLAEGYKKRAQRVLRRAWVGGNFGKRQERTFFKRYRKLLRKDDHLKRLERLLWNGRYWASRRMLWRVGAGHRALAEARMALRHRRGNVDRAIARVPAELKDHPGLIYERLRWRRRKGLDMSARDLLSDLPDDLGRPDLWAKERAILARRALQAGHISEAYRIAKDHGLDNGAAFAEAEWLAGWIALRFLGDYEVARNHFSTMYDSVRYPVSRARGAYWVGRTEEALSGHSAAEPWYQTAARYPTTYYGQLATARLKPAGGGFALPPEPKPDAAQVTAFAEHELVRVARILGQIGENKRLKPFILGLSSIETSPGWRALSASLAVELDRPDLAIRVSKLNNRAGRGLVAEGYPVPDVKPLFDRAGKPLVEIPLVLSLVRQESGFFTKARSPAGARGLMQMLPRTAYRTARTLKIPYSRRRLTSDADYNLKLGQAHLATLLKSFDGSYVLALAAYNAGPSRVRKWVNANGDPRDATVNVIDWIEMIPFNETRNYVQRVLENLQVYRLRLAKTKVALTLEGDLRR